MAAQIEREGDRYWVTCDQHSWRWEATGGASHATNLAAKHDREYTHDDPAGPSTLDVSAGARYLLVCHADRDTDGDPAALPYKTASASAYYAALDMWQALTGLTGDDALAYARQVADRPTTAVIPPF